MQKVIGYHSLRSVLVSISLILGLIFCVSCSKNETPVQKTNPKNLEIKSKKLSSETTSTSSKTLFVACPQKNLELNLKSIKRPIIPMPIFTTLVLKPVELPSETLIEMDYLISFLPVLQVAIDFTVRSHL